jgi:hypothetical protein
MKTINGTVTVGVEDGVTGKRREETAPVVYPEFENAEDVLNHLSLGGTEAEVAERHKAFLHALNYGFNLDARSVVNQNLRAKLEGPDKAINKLVNDIVKARAAAGMPISEPDARKLAVTMLGIEVPATA